MTPESLRDRLIRMHRLTFDCEQIEDSIKVTTPYVYPDGERVAVFVCGPEGQETVTDFGCMTRWIKRYTGYSPDDSQNKWIDWVCKIKDIHRCGEELVWPHPHYEHIETSINELAKAASWAADAVFEAKDVERMEERMRDFEEMEER